MSHYGNPSPGAPWSAMHTPQQAQHEAGQSLPVWNWLLAGTALWFQSQCSAIM